MLDRHEGHNDRNAGHQAPVPNGASGADRPLADREVPLSGMAAADSAPALAIHQWLDGDTSEAEARRADAKQVDLWKMIGTETEQRRRVTAPAHLAANIMAALPAAHVDMQAIVTTSTTTITSSQAIVESKPGVPMTMILLVGTAICAIGLVIGKML